MKRKTNFGVQSCRYVRVPSNTLVFECARVSGIPSHLYLRTLFILFLSPLPPGLGSGLTFPRGDRVFWADPGPDPVGNLFFLSILALTAAGSRAVRSGRNWT